MSKTAAPRRAVFFFSTFGAPGTVGATGGVISNYHLCRAVADILPTTIITFASQDEPSRRRIERLGDNVVTVISMRSSFLPGLSALRWPRHLQKTIRASGVEPLEDTLLFLSSTTLGLAGWARRRGAVPVAVVRAFEDFGAFIPGGNLKARINGFRQAFARGFQAKGAMRSAAACLVNSDFMGDCVRARFGSEIPTRTIYPPLDLTVTAGSPADRSTVGFVNRSADKNGDFVCELARYMPDHRFLVFGQPIDSASLPNVEYQGWESNRDRLFSSAAKWIVPSRWQEPFGRVAIEALAKGAAVCVSRRGGLPEAVGEWGTILDTFDVADWAVAIREAKANPGQADGVARFAVAVHDRRVADFIRDLTTIAPREEE